MAQRRRDALAALQWLAARDDVNAAKLALVGWSNGGSTVLAASNLAHAEVAGAGVLPAALVAFYPGCETELRRGYRPSAPLLLLLGGSDDWTSPLPCQALQAQAAPPRPQLRVYDGAHHGFDGRAPVRLRADVPNGVHPGAGVHVGASPEARADAQRQS
jgi:dienelactone hydrolase